MAFSSFRGPGPFRSMWRWGRNGLELSLPWQPQMPRNIGIIPGCQGRASVRLEGLSPAHSGLQGMSPVLPGRTRSPMWVPSLYMRKRKEEPCVTYESHRVLPPTNQNLTHRGLFLSLFLLRPRFLSPSLPSLPTLVYDTDVSCVSKPRCSSWDGVGCKNVC